MPENEQGVFVEKGKVITRVTPEVARNPKYQEEYANLVGLLEKYGTKSEAFEFELERLNKAIDQAATEADMNVKDTVAARYFRKKEMTAAIWSALCLLVIPIVTVIIYAIINWASYSDNGSAVSLTVTNTSTDTLVNTLVNICIFLVSVVSIGVGWPVFASMSCYYSVLKKKVVGDRSSRALMYIAMVFFISWIGAIVVYLNTDKLTHEEILSKVKVK